MKSLLLDDIYPEIVNVPLYGVEDPTADTPTNVTIIAAILLVVIGVVVGITMFFKKKKSKEIEKQKSNLENTGARLYGSPRPPKL
ncbi:MAG: hypothetical protein IKI57_00770 [Clostridia bacterium]|nr:hypothetical protein [Clostridia bacterium]